VRLKCQFGCGSYNERLTCPPYSPTPEQTRKLLSEYSLAILLRVNSPGGLESEDPLRLRFNEVVAGLEREIFLSGQERAYGMGSGPCPFCERCDITEPCLHPREARPSMEGCGIDVFSTVRKSGWRIEVITSEISPFSLFGLVLIY
jgi:predicted metal-binding protein